jgi:hypothetical protein
MKPSSLLRPTLFALAVSASLFAARADEAKGVVYHDQNGNGTRDAGEPGLPDVAVSNQREIVKTDANPLRPRAFGGKGAEGVKMEISNRSSDP